ncbi:uncharacterized protein [Watersipora subatra]|uniref:uncharacterized protein n=1 Tax=Watersipora subatra TaxID=2589382 RepID=UPI00355B1DA6
MRVYSKANQITSLSNKSKTFAILPHIMISYQWDVKKNVLKFRKELRKAGYRVWIDVEQMHKDIAVDNSAAVIPVLTEKYQQSINCRKEIEFADKRKKPLVPICLQEQFELAPWLEFLIGANPAYELHSRKRYAEELQNCLNALAVKAASAKEKQDDEGGDEEEGRKSSKKN